MANKPDRFDREFIAGWIVFGVVIVVGWWCAYHLGIWIMTWR